jgi:hypothetical protein
VKKERILADGSGEVACAIQWTRKSRAHQLCPRNSIIILLFYKPTLHAQCILLTPNYLIRLESSCLGQPLDDPPRPPHLPSLLHTHRSRLRANTSTQTTRHITEQLTLGLRKASSQHEHVKYASCILPAHSLPAHPAQPCPPMLVHIAPQVIHHHQVKSIVRL